MKAVAFANNDIAVVAWTFGGKLPKCLGFAVYRIDVRAGTETCLPAMATFSGQDARSPAARPLTIRSRSSSGRTSTPSAAAPISTRSCR